MSSFVKISEGAALAIHACALLAQNSEGYFPVKILAERLKGSSAHLSKVMQRLAKTGIVTGLRGPKGGFFLARPAAEITLLEIFQAIEGATAPVECVFDEPVCGWGHCLFRGLIPTLDQKFIDYLKGTTLAALAHNTWTISDRKKLASSGKNS
jgi:Rrf2 family protein